MPLCTDSSESFFLDHQYRCDSCRIHSGSHRMVQAADQGRNPLGEAFRSHLRHLYAVCRSRLRLLFLGFAGSSPAFPGGHGLCKCFLQRGPACRSDADLHRSGIGDRVPLLPASGKVLWQGHWLRYRVVSPVSPIHRDPRLWFLCVRAVNKKGSLSADTM